MADPYVGEIRLVGFTFAPNGWSYCDGSQVSIAQNSVLFNLIGTTYGGDGVNTFNLPDLRGRFPVHFGTGTGLSAYPLGTTLGVENVTLTSQQIPSHSHGLPCSSAAGTSRSPIGNYFAAEKGGEALPYTSGPANVSTGAAIATDFSGGSSVPHFNMPPYLVMNFCISLFGVYPSQT